VQQRKQDYVSAHPNLEPKIAKLIMDGEICIGMTEDEVRASWGNGTENRSASLDGTFDQWIYHSSFYGAAGTYLYFKNGSLVSYQEIH